MRHRVRIASFAVLALAAPVARAQDVRIADSLLRQGFVDRAETEYYAASRARPRDPAARFALGKYLLDRGAFRIGATLIDEAMQFGYDRATGSVALVRVYMNLGEYVAADRFALSAGLPPEERALIKWLAARSPRADSVDAAALVAFNRVGIPGYLGTVRMRLNGQSITALVSPNSTCGVQVPDTAAVVSTLHRFGSGATPSGVSYAAADSLAFGRMSMRNIPIELVRARELQQVVICLGMLARFAPTFDSRANLLTLHGNGVAAPPSRASMVAALLDVGGEFSVLRGTTWSPLGSREAAVLLGDRRWILDPRRRQVAIEP
jgi:hypothetical protein